jgi:hypothetical protein
LIKERTKYYDAGEAGSFEVIEKILKIILLKE